ncbi:glycoside hydrolase family 36 protein [Candidatus Harpocratesius sp.]
MEKSPNYQYIMPTIHLEKSAQSLMLNLGDHTINFHLHNDIIYFSLQNDTISLKGCTGAIFLQKDRNLFKLFPSIINKSLATTEIIDFNNEIGTGKQIQLKCYFKSLEDLTLELPCRWRFQFYTSRKNGLKFHSNPFFLSIQILIDLIPTKLASYGLYAYAPLYCENNGTLHLIQENKIQNPENITFFSNGWQSWSNNYLLTYYDKWVSSPVKLARINMENQEKLLKGRYQSEWHTVISDIASQSNLILSFITLKDQFSRIVMNRLKSEGKIEWLCAYSQCDSIILQDLNEGLRKSEILMVTLNITPEAYEILTETCRIGGLIAKKPNADKILTGWCSWYYYYTKVKETDVISNLEFFKNHIDYPIDLIQLDDGYQRAIGDWGTQNSQFNSKFPHGLKWLVEKIHQTSFQAGLWIAPFFMTKNSEFFQMHKEWILKNKKNMPVSTAFNWGANQYAIDLSRTEVLEYLSNQARTISNEWGFDFLKIDFLYASEVIDFIYHDQKYSRAQILRRGLQSIRNGFGNSKKILGCGCPLGPAVGMVDIMRIGPDTAASWFKNEFLFYKLAKISVTSLKAALKSTIQRSYMHNTWWINDPDCVIVRENRSHLTEAEIQLELTIFGLSGGQILISDDEKLVSRERLDLLNRLLPPYSHKFKKLPYHESIKLVNQDQDLIPESIPLDIFSSQNPSLYAKTIRICDIDASERHLICVINWKNQKSAKTYKLNQLIIFRYCNLYKQGQKFVVFDYWNEEILGIYKIDENILLQPIPAHGCKYLAIIPLIQVEAFPLFISSTVHICQGVLEIKRLEINEKSGAMTINLELPGKHAGDLYFFAKEKFSVPSCTHTITIKQIKWGFIYKIHVYIEYSSKIEIVWERR